MKRGLVVVAIVLLLVAARVATMQRFETGDSVAIGLVYDVDESRANPNILPAFERGLAAAGIPAVPVAQTGQLLLLTGPELAHRFPALILADGINRRAPAALADRLRDYVKAGGSLAIVNDAASQDRLGHYLGHGRLIDLAGVDYVRYGALGAQSYVTGAIAFADVKTAHAWNVPAVDLAGPVLTSAMYGNLRYPLPASRVIARGVTAIASDGGIPVITVRHLGPSTILFVGLPLGYLESRGDVSPLRFTMQTFARSLIVLPYVDAKAAPGTSFAFRRGKGELDVELHGRMPLAGLGVAIPQQWLGQGALPPGIREDGVRDDHRYFVCSTTSRDLSLRFSSHIE